MFPPKVPAKYKKGGVRRCQTTLDGNGTSNLLVHYKIIISDEAVMIYDPEKSRPLKINELRQ